MLDLRPREGQVVDEENTTPIVEPEIQHENVEPQSEPIEEVQTQDLRRSSRVRQEPDRYLGFLVSQDSGDLNEPTSYGEAMSGNESEQWQEAMKAEMQSMYDNQVWELTDLPQHCRAVGRKWVFKKKTDMDGNVHTFKARLVAKGFTQTHGIDYDETFSPVAMLKSIRILMAISAYFNYEIWQMDVKTTFLNGKLTEDVYMEQPVGFEDPKNPNKSVKSWLSKCFQMKDLGEAAYILGIKIYRNRSKWLIGLSQSTYIDKILKRFRMDESKKGFIPMQHGIVLSKSQCPVSSQDQDRMKLVPYASAIGSFMHAILCTRPDVAYSITVGVRFTLNGGAISWKSSKQDTIADSTTEAEYIAASDAAKEAVWLRNFLSDLRVVASVSRPMDIFCDNSGAVAQAKEPREHHKSRHVLRKYHLIREIIGRGDVRICKIPTEENVADPLTKPLARVKHEAHANSMSFSVIPFYTPKESLRLINGKWKLTGQNFPVWKMHLDNILRAHGKFYDLEKPVSRPKSNSPEEEFTQYFKYMADESDVMSILIFSISSEFADRLRDKSCHEVVKDIESPLGFYRHTGKLLIMKEILSLKLKKDQSVKDHLMEMRRLFKCLTRLGYKMTQEELVYLMWYSLPKEICDTASAYMKEPKTDVAALHENITT
ncbi:hypothetical protein OSB04_032291 [Centaurea solstitialis]|uniref:Reverse transcriptase Ty1/copia-type domain-containing protein n=1 Tax=Centaurea solstitialis TaxID=347529 RepID=A0AA38SWA8_9ASTR|nr:hypothetical protein OSB04_032291 [Centaurea solstitialis]